MNSSWGVLLLAFQRFVDDVAANRPPPPPDEAGANPATLVPELEAALPHWQAAWAKYRGYESGTADLLKTLSDAGVPYASSVRTAVLMTPGALTALEEWLPKVDWLLGALNPAATGIQGDDHSRGRG